MNEHEIKQQLSQLEALLANLGQNCLQRERDHLHLSASVLALTQGFIELASKLTPIDRKTLADNLVKSTQAHHQKLLSGLEDKNPFHAALLDDRTLPEVLGND